MHKGVMGSKDSPSYPPREYSLIEELLWYQARLKLLTSKGEDEAGSSIKILRRGTPS